LAIWSGATPWCCAASSTLRGQFDGGGAVFEFDDGDVGRVGGQEMADGFETHAGTMRVAGRAPTIAHRLHRLLQDRPLIE